jgi:ABC-2 type transport system ATP-binding protein
LDEPTIGLDVAVKARIRAFIKTIQRDLGDIADLCRRLIMSDSGKIVFDGPLDMITARFGRDRVVHLLLSAVVPYAAAQAQHALSELPAAAGG